MEQLLQRASAAFAEYRTTTFAERSRHLITAADLLEGELPDLARILTTEMGKTFAAAKAEVAKCAVGLRWFAEHAERAAGRREHHASADAVLRALRAAGPVLAVMPWNFPMWQVIRFAAPALMAGNVGLLKHASNVPADGAGDRGPVPPGRLPRGRLHHPLRGVQGRRRTSSPTRGSPRSP